jgi:hypothetical protein
MRVALLLLTIVACGPATKPAPTDVRVALTDAMTKAATDVATMSRLLRGPVVIGGLWFADPTCASSFGAGRTVDPIRSAELARCLVGLRLTASTRADALADVVVMTYAPGFEVEARIVSESDGPRLGWIGFASHSQNDALPTISAATLESLRVAGAVAVPLPVEVTKVLDADRLRMIETEGRWVESQAGFHFTWIKTCLDEAGAVRSVTPYETTHPLHQRSVVEVAKQWRFKPFTIQDQPAAVCAMTRVEYPPAAAPQPEELPLPLPPPRTRGGPIVLASVVGPRLLETRRTAGNRLLVPDDTDKLGLNGQRLESRFRYCVDETGAVDTVVPLRSTGVAGYDAKLLAGIRAWKYAPYEVDGHPTAVCTRMTMVYVQAPR